MLRTFFLLLKSKQNYDSTIAGLMQKIRGYPIVLVVKMIFPNEASTSKFIVDMLDTNVRNEGNIIKPNYRESKSFPK